MHWFDHELNWPTRLFVAFLIGVVTIAPVAVAVFLVVLIGRAMSSGSIVVLGFTAGVAILSVWLAWKLGRPLREQYRQKR